MLLPMMLFVAVSIAVFCCWSALWCCCCCCASMSLLQLIFENKQLLASGIAVAVVVAIAATVATLAMTAGCHSVAAALIGE